MNREKSLLQRLGLGERANLRRDVGLHAIERKRTLERLNDRGQRVGSQNPLLREDRFASNASTPPGAPRSPRS